MITIKTSKENLQLILQALDFYSRVGAGQFDKIKDHPTFQRSVLENNNEDWGKFHEENKVIDMILTDARNRFYGDHSVGLNGGWGIHNEKVDESCRQAFDLLQIIRHEFWKNNPNRCNITVDSSIHLTSKNVNDENFKIQN